MNGFRAFPFFLILLCLFSTASAENTSRFEIVDNEMVYDAVTKKMWQKNDSHHELKKGMNWYDALEYVAKKNGENFAGHNDWRLPTLKELIGIWDAKLPTKSNEGEAIGLPVAFTSGGSYYLWTQDERGLDNAWYFGLGQKEDYFNLKDLDNLDQGVKMVRNAE